VTPLTATRLFARTREIEPPASLLDAMAADGTGWLTDEGGFVTAGAAAVVPVSEAAVTLAAIDGDDPIGLPGSGPLAIGALPYDDPACGAMVVPRRLTGIAPDGRAWETLIGDDVVVDPPAAEAAGPFTVAATSTRAAWSDRVLATLGAIESGQFDKAVLAREVLVDADVPFDVRVVVDRLQRAQGGSFVFAVPGFVGATPELLVRRSGLDVVSRPIAGTRPRGSTVAADAGAAAALRASAKDSWEHRLVVEAVVAELGDAGVTLDPVGPPEVDAFGTVLHLATTVHGRLARADGPSALDLARALHPTPAIGGAPRGPATEWLRKIEGMDRGRYGGPVGWIDRHGNGEWAVALRCAEVDGRRARLLAGAGIVAGSDPDAEWAETQAKLAPMLAALVQP
jgi:menaquinone-specific isochorismate synthase